MTNPLPRVLLGCALLLLAPATASAADELWMCIPTVTGTCDYNGGTNSFSPAADGWVPVQNVSYALSNVPPASAPHGPGVLTPRPTQVVRALDGLSPVLALHALQGQALPTLKVGWRRAGVGSRGCFRMLVLTNARVARLHTSTDGNENTAETMVLNAASHELRAWRTDATGNATGAPEVATWAGGVP